ncbi:MAG TPA: glycosyltransferase family 2 protein [Actinomycetota bacterium]|nr:glycosyltransferase family 2 protein [Actinomycetota bacterium]
MPGRQLLTVVMPVHNERATLREAVGRFQKTKLPLPAELVVVDDGSTDGSLYAVADLAEPDRVRLIRRPGNRGKGAAIRAGIEAARGDVLTILDADLEYDPADMGRLLEPILTGDATVTYGTRAFGSHTAFSFWYVVGNRIVNLWASMLFDAWLSDVYTCLKMAPTEIWRTLDLRSNDFRIEAEVTAKLLARGERIYEVPIGYRARSRQEGKKIRGADGLRALWVLLRIRVTGR